MWLQCDGCTQCTVQVLNSLPRFKINMIKLNRQGHVSEDNHNIDIKNSTWWVGQHFISSGQGLVAGCCEQCDEFLGYVTCPKLIV